MPEDLNRKHRRVIDYVEEQIGGDINRDLLKIAISDQDVDALAVDTDDPGDVGVSLDEVRGTNLTGADWTTLLQNIAELEDALESVGTDQLRARIFMEDADGNRVGLDGQDLGTDITTTTVGVVTYLARALNTIGEDELVSRISDSQGTQIDPLADDVTVSVGTDEVRVAIVGEDSDGNEYIAPAEQFNQDLTETDASIATYVSRALDSIQQDELRTSAFNDNEAKFGVRDDQIRAGDTWVVRPNERADMKDFDIDGTLWLDGELYSYGPLTGDGSIEGDGTITSRT